MSIRNVLARILHKPKSWDREQRLSVSGVYDYALSTPMKRELIINIDDLTEPYNNFNRLADRCSYREIMRDRVPNDDQMSGPEVKKEYIKYITIPHLLDCNVLTVNLLKETDEKENYRVQLSSLDELVDLGYLDAYDPKYKQNPEVEPNFASDFVIDMLFEGPRFSYAKQALEATCRIDAECEFLDRKFE